ncbi:MULTISPECIES: acyl-CoA dehydrogenase family protein [unclassified Pseudomonas]|jgi:alkylation response protein AidB-like acyl-CoA dehydrogenase|uniref:acyl-CoA dehydrogenase family protein n=1 Tax=unclassified Pseudomonas TaxID=196821 RepID=UPI00069D76CE|nr:MULTISPECIES: acyl-CoA dehydrogenase family protein [unclassified Pseudomonas]WPN44703.1 acyl-CoA dehydrogenase family protein [Pseudomonas sp. P8_241]
MDIQYTPAELAFREEVRAFLHDKLPPELAAKGRLGKRLTKHDYVSWMAALNERGWYASLWPAELGGTGWSEVQKHIFEDECAAFGAPPVLPFGVVMVGPVIIKFGTEEQKAHYLPRILDGTDWWCQGYSEPGAGSDLASLKTRAVRDGDHYVVTGQKTWTTQAQFADWIFCLVRTNSEAQAQRGISFLLIDMKSPGISVRPIITLDGDHEVNEVFFDDVRVPVANLVGEENHGWTYAKYLLTHERTTVAGIGTSKAQLRQLKHIAGREQRNRRPLIDDPLFRAQIAEVEMQLIAAEMSTLRMLAAARDGGGIGAASSFLKVKGSEIRQSLSHLMRKAVGPYALPFLDAEQEQVTTDNLLHTEYSSTVSGQYFNLRKLSIFGGSNEIQKNIVSKMILEL